MANKFLNGIEVSSSAVVDGGSLSTGSTILDIQGSQGQLFSVTNSLVGDLFSVSDISGVPILNVNSSGLVTIDGNLNLGDSDKIQLGASQDLQIYHDGSTSFIKDAGTGNLEMWADGAVIIKSGDGTETKALFDTNGSVDLYYDNSKKLETTSTGVTVTGNISAITTSGHAFMLGNSDNTSTADTSGFRLHQSSYADGRYTHRFRKYDEGGGVPLYIDGSGSTANVFTALARFGAYTNESKTFEVFGTMGATNFSGSSSGTNTGDQVLPSDFVIKSTGGTFDGNLTINIADNGSAPAMTSTLNLKGYEGRGAGIKIKDSANSAADPSSREWFIGSGYAQSGFNIGYSSTGYQSSYAAQNKFTLTTAGNATFAGTVAGSNLSGTNTGDQDLSGYSTTGHNHDDRYYTETEIDAQNVTLNETLAALRGWVPGFSNDDDSSLTWDRTEDALRIYNADSSIGAVYKAMRVTAGMTIRVTVTVKGDVAGTDGLYLRLEKHDGDLPDGKTHVSHDAINSSEFVQEDDSEINTWYENGAISTDWVTHEKDVEITSDGYISFLVLNWTGNGTNSVWVKTPDIQIVTAATVATNANLTGHVTSVGNAAILGSFTTAELNAAISDGAIPTDFVSAANGGTFGGNLTIKHATSPTLTLTDDSPDPDNIGKIDVANTYMTFALDSTDGIDSSRMRFQLDGANIIEVLPNTTYFRQTNIHLQNTSTSSVSFRKDAAIEAGDDLGKINFIATNDEGTTYVTGGNIIYEGDGTWDLSTINNAPTRMKIQLRDSSGTLANAMMLSSNLNANFYGDLTVAGNLTVSGTTTTLNTETVEVKDNILQLNTTQGSPNTATAATSGISVFRGLDSNGNDTITQASLIFDEGDDIWDLTNNLTVAGDVIGASFAVPSGASTGFLKADGSVDGTTYSGYNFGATDLAFQGADPGDIVWKDAEGTEVHRIWSGSTDYLTYRNDAGTTYELISAGSTSYNNSNWDTAYTHSQAAHAPTNAEANVQADWNETSTTSDAFILNKLTDYVSAASGGTFSGDLTINADLTINGSTDGNGAVTPRILDFTTNPTNAGLAGSSGYQIGEISFTGKDSSSNAAGKYGRIRGSIVDSNTTVQGSGGEGGKLQFTLLKHDVGAQPRVEYDILTLDPLVAEVDGQLEVTGNIQLTGGGTIEAPSVNGGEDLILKAAGGVDVIIDSNGNGGDNEIFRVMHHTSAVLFEVQEGGEVRFQDGIRISGIEDRISSVGSSMYIGGGGFGNSLVQFSGKPIPDSNYYFDFGASNRYWNHCYLGTIHLGSTLLSNQLNTNIDASTSPELVGQVAIATYTAAFFDFVVKKGTNIRSGTVYACHDGTNVEFTETSTNDLGNTSDVTLSVDISGANMRLLATVTSDDWSVKSLIRAI
jgi:hypothetical protein